MVDNSLDYCPGAYCGRTLYHNGSRSDCGACERGYRVNDSSICAPCQGELKAYSWLYLGFMGLLPLMLHFFFIDLDAKDRQFSRKQIILSGCAVVEISLSALLAILLIEPMWEFRLHACEVVNFSDWYTLFYNPTPNYLQRLHCTQEAVYPLQTIVLIFYFLCLVAMCLIRPVVSLIMDVRGKGKAPIYSALYFLPLLTLVHSLGGGLIYYSFPYLSIVISMLANAIHYSLKMDQTVSALIRNSLMEAKDLVIILTHWLVLAYGIIALDHHYALLCLVPFPTIFYIVTVRFTDPMEFQETEGRSG